MLSKQCKVDLCMGLSLHTTRLGLVQQFLDRPRLYSVLRPINEMTGQKMADQKILFRSSARLMKSGRAFSGICKGSRAHAGCEAEESNPG